MEDVIGDKTVEKDSSFPDERQAYIAHTVAIQGKVRVSQLTERFGVSEPTVRKDLAALEEKGLLKRTHGGAVSVRPPAEQEVASRQARNLEAKVAIARACVRLLSSGEAVFLDNGSTVLQIAHALADSGLRLTVLTGAPAVAEAVADAPGITHLLLGGQLRKLSGCLLGPLASENLKLFRIGAAFIGVSGVSEGGITVADLSESSLKAAVIAQAQRVIVPIDHSKVGLSDFVKVCDLDEIDTIVSDRSTEYLETLCRSHGIELVNAEVP
ncbi:MAG: DeoR/GlpR transcriptional regulator [Verrucomicrobia bacterium]|nr:DeoR/GlpR transcriptional regulator [Verrucomicrobiota bacterium]